MNWSAQLLAYLAAVASVVTQRKRLRITGLVRNQAVIIAYITLFWACQTNPCEMTGFRQSVPGCDGVNGV